MQKWKYKLAVVKIPAFAKEADILPAVEDKLNRLAMEGWELVHALQMPGHSQTQLYMKRAY